MCKHSLCTLHLNWISLICQGNLAGTPEEDVLVERPWLSKPSQYHCQIFCPPVYAPNNVSPSTFLASLYPPLSLMNGPGEITYQRIITAIWINDASAWQTGGWWGRGVHSTAIWLSVIEIVINYLRLPYPKTTQGPGSVIGPICQSEKLTHISDQLGN